MNKRINIIIFIICCFLLIGGCQSMNETEKNPSEKNGEDLPDVRALKDEFTRKFIQSTEEVEDGYYPFLSGTGKYEMLFPAEGQIDNRGYSVREKSYEAFLIAVINENDTASQITVDYYGTETAEGSSIKLKSLEGRVGQELDFTKTELESTVIHHAPISFEGNIFGIAAYVQNVKGSGGIQIIYDTDCDAEQLDCTTFRQEEEKKIIQWISSIEFINE